ncbi:MAG: T9SS type A sorting domain-containing protein [Candidatus Kapabacteria bacterium]|nr:T9SS type A sorting domain-containing protein [Candidatus Kapabacteria bacterium]
MKYFILLSTLVSLLFSHNSLEAQIYSDEELKMMTGSSNIGTEFYMTFHPAWGNASKIGEIKIFVSSIFITNVTLSIPALNKIETKKTKHSDVIEFTLTPEEAQMYLMTSENATIKPEKAQVYSGRAIIITADDPVICYGVIRSNGKSEGYMAMPTHVLGQKYQIATQPDPSNNTSQFMPSYTSIVGVYDNTKITFRLGGNSTTEVDGMGGLLKPGDVARATLNKGDVWLIAGSGANNDLTGSTVSATKPVAVISGNFCMGDKDDLSNCDYTIEQQTPENTWGKNYIVTPIANRKKFPITRIFTSVPENSIKMDGIEIAQIKSPGGQIGSGYIEVRTGDTGIPTPVRISSYYPINVVQYNPSSSDDDVASSPFQMQVIPTEQFSKNVIFSTISTEEDFEYETNYYNLVYLATIDGEIPDDMVIKHSGNFWNAVKGLAEPGIPVYGQEKDGRQYYSTILPITETRLHQIEAKDPFGVYSYGNDKSTSFGTTSTSKMLDLVSADTVAPLVTYDVSYSGEVVGTLVDIAQTGVEPSGLASLTMFKMLSDNFQLIPPYITAGKTINSTFGLKAIDYWKAAEAVLVATDRRGNNTIVKIKYKPTVVLSINTDDFNLGMIKSGKFRDFNLTLANDDFTTSVPLKALKLKSNDPQFEIIQNIESGSVLSSLEEQEFTVRFHAHDLYSDDIENLEQVFKTSFIIVLMEHSRELEMKKEIEIEVANPRIIADDVDFSTHMIDETIEHQYLKISNPGKMPLLITKFDFPAESPFVLDLPAATEANPFEIEPFGEYLVKTEFIPIEPGEFSDTLTITSDAYIIKNVAVISASAIPSSVLDNNLYGGKFAVNYDGNSITFLAEHDAIVSGLKIYDLIGRNIFNSDITNKINEYRVAVPAIKTGVYLLHINIDGIWMSKKLIIS